MVTPEKESDITAENYVCKIDYSTFLSICEQAEPGEYFYVLVVLCI